MAQPKQHDWQFACKTASGGAGGGEDVFVCTGCGCETTDPASHHGGCNGERASCPECWPHPKHTGKCVFACDCKRLSAVDRYGGAVDE